MTLVPFAVMLPTLGGFDISGPSSLYAIIRVLNDYYVLRMTQQTTRLQINVPVKIKEDFEQAAIKYGMDVSSAIRFMMVQFNHGYIMPSLEKGIPVVDEQTEREIGEALDDFKKGDYITIESEKDLRGFLDELKHE